MLISFAYRQTTQPSKRAHFVLVHVLSPTVFIRQTQDFDSEETQPQEEQESYDLQPHGALPFVSPFVHDKFIVSMVSFITQIVGGQGIGKTSLLRLLLETAEISPTATAEQRANLERFLTGPTKRTNAIDSACIEICESKYDRLLFTVIDTPGLDFHDELRLEHQVSAIVRHMDEQFADTLREVCDTVFTHVPYLMMVQTRNRK